MRGESQVFGIVIHLWGRSLSLGHISQRKKGGEKRQKEKATKKTSTDKVEILYKLARNLRSELGFFSFWLHYFMLGSKLKTRRRNYTNENKAKKDERDR